MKRSFLFYIVCIMVLIAPLYALAQTASSDVFIETSPQFPEAGDTFTVKLNAPNTNYASIRWFINGTEDTTHTNEPSLSLTALGIGSQTTITARATLQNGEVFEARKIVTPYRIDFMVNADTNAPAFYAGRKLPSSGSSVTVTALFFTKKTSVSQEGYSYVWRVNNKPQYAGSIVGKNMITFTPSFEDRTLIEVDILKNGQLVATRSEFIPVVKPELYFYEKKPLRGLSLIAAPNPFIFIGDEVILRGETYFMSKASPDEQLMEWGIDSNTIQNDTEDRQEITLSKQSRNGQSEVSFHMRNLSQFLQGVKKSITVQF